MIVATWITVLGLLTLLFDDQLTNMRNPNASPAVSKSQNGSKRVVLKRNHAGQYVANGFINQRSVRFIIDTGATDVSVPAHLAKKLKLEPGHPVIYRTANGDVRGNRTRIASVSLGNITLEDIPGSINPGMTEDLILLGMSFLKKLEMIQRDGTLILTQHP